MEVIIIDNGSKEQIGRLKLNSQPQNGEYIEFNEILYSIFKVIHTKNDIKVLVIRVR